MGGNYGFLRPVAPQLHYALPLGLLPFRQINVVACRTPPMYQGLQHAIVIVAVVTPLLGLSAQSVQGAERPRTQLAARSVELIEEPTFQPEPLKLPGSALEPIDWNALDGWAVDDHAAAFAHFPGQLPSAAADHAAEGRDAPDVFRPETRLP